MIKAASWSPCTPTVIHLVWWVGVLTSFRDPLNLTMASWNGKSLSPPMKTPDRGTFRFSSVSKT